MKYFASREPFSLHGTGTILPIKVFSGVVVHRTCYGVVGVNPNDGTKHGEL